MKIRDIILVGLFAIMATNIVLIGTIIGIHIFIGF